MSAPTPDVLTEELQRIHDLEVRMFSRLPTATLEHFAADHSERHLAELAAQELTLRRPLPKGPRT
jgi:hypothetical protein